MTRKEFSGIRELNFSQWVRSELPCSSTGFSVSDLDFVIWNWKTKKIMLLEIKTRKALPKPGQWTMWMLLDKWIKVGIQRDWTYVGFHLVQFENTFFDDGKCFLGDRQVSEAELKDFLSLK